MQPQQTTDIPNRWTQHQRRNHSKTTPLFPCNVCRDRAVFQSAEALREHALTTHPSEMPTGRAENDKDDKTRRAQFRTKYEAESSLLQKRRSKDDSPPKKPSFADNSNQVPEPQISLAKRQLASPGGPSRSLAALKGLKIDAPKGSENITMREDLSEGSESGQPRKKAAIGDGISAGSGSPYRESPSPPSPQPQRSRARKSPDSELQRPHVPNKKLWRPDMDPLTKPSVASPSSLTLASNPKNQKQFALPPYPNLMRHDNLPSSIPPGNPAGPVRIFSRANTAPAELQGTASEGTLDLIREPETRPISQEQLIAEVKGIYAGLVMVEAKCIEVDNKQAALIAEGGAAAQTKLNHEQWQALIALHRTLLHEHHDFFLASQHPSASPALRRLASKYAMPARMWRHGIHSFLELLRHRLPASLDHMLAFIYLAYSMMALLFETVPAFEDTWVECLGDLGRYRMAIEDDDVRDREVWTGVSKHWYSKASDTTPTTGRLYHHLAILARPNALQQLFYYSKSLCVAIPFKSARESILTLFDPVLNPVSGPGQYRLPPLDTAFVKAHGLLFTNKDMEKFKPAVQDFLGLLDNHIGRVTSKFLEQGYFIAVSNSVAILGFGSPENPLVNLRPDELTGIDSGAPVITKETSMKLFLDAENLANESLKIVLQRIGDPNVLPFIHVTLVFMYFMSRHSGTIQCLRVKFPWQLLTEMLNPLLASYTTLDRIENTAFPLPIKDHVRPFAEDFAIRGLLWAEGYYPKSFFDNDKIDDEEKHLEVASMVHERKERILWLACRIADAEAGIYYHKATHQFSTSPIGAAHLVGSKSPSPPSDTSTAHSNPERLEIVQAAVEARSDTGHDHPGAPRAGMIRGCIEQDMSLRNFTSRPGI